VTSSISLTAVILKIVAWIRSAAALHVMPRRSSQGAEDIRLHQVTIRLHNLSSMNPSMDRKRTRNIYIVVIAIEENNIIYVVEPYPHLSR
jgi:hypothetical protein